MAQFLPIWPSDHHPTRRASIVQYRVLQQQTLWPWIGTEPVKRVGKKHGSKVEVNKRQHQHTTSEPDHEQISVHTERMPSFRRPFTVVEVSHFRDDPTRRARKKNCLGWIFPAVHELSEVPVHSSVTREWNGEHGCTALQRIMFMCSVIISSVVLNEANYKIKYSEKRAPRQGPPSLFLPVDSCAL